MTHAAHRKFITLISAAAIAVAGLTASQAQAGDKRTRNLILGATTLAIIGAAIANADRDDDRPSAHSHGHGHGHAHDSDYPRGPRAGIHPRPLPPRVMLSELPQRCSFTAGTNTGTHRFFEKRCLERNYRHANRLPRDCRRTVRLGSRKVEAYGGGCLREHSRNTAWLNRR